MTGSTIHLDYLFNLHNLKDRNNDLIQLRQFAQANKIPIIDEITADFYSQILQISKPKLLLEIGTAIGFSAILAAQCLSSDAQIITVEKSTDNIKLARENFAKFDIHSKIELLEGDAKQILPSLNRNFDFIFLDADKQDYLELLPLIIDNLQAGGILFVDNLLWKGEVADYSKKLRKAGVEILREFNIRFINHAKLNSTILPIGDGVGLAIKI